MRNAAPAAIKPSVRTIASSQTRQRTTLPVGDSLGSGGGSTGPAWINVTRASSRQCAHRSGRLMPTATYRDAAYPFPQHSLSGVIGHAMPQGVVLCFVCGHAGVACSHRDPWAGRGGEGRRTARTTPRSGGAASAGDASSAGAVGPVCAARAGADAAARSCAGEDRDAGDATELAPAAGR